MTWWRTWLLRDDTSATQAAILPSSSQLYNTPTSSAAMIPLWTSILSGGGTSASSSTFTFAGLGQTATTSTVYNTLHQQTLAQQQAIMAQHYNSQAADQAAVLHAILSAFPQQIGMPAIVRHDEHLRIDRELYRRAIGEHDEQEAARLLRQIEAREQSMAEQRRQVEEAQQRQSEERARIVGAQARAQELLLEHLTPVQRETFLNRGFFVVEGGRSRTRYRIRGSSSAGNIDVLDRSDRTTHRLCGHARAGIPLCDHLLAQKITLELAEDDFLRIANRHSA